jgi:uncharacterized protein YxjI
MTDTGNPAAWHPDPFGRHELRYWDGAQWTEHVSSHGRQSTDPPVGAGAVPTTARSTEKIVGDVAKAGAQSGTNGGGTIFTEPVLVVNQKAKLIEVNNEYAIYDQNGTQIGAVRQVGQSAAKKVLRVLTSVDQFMTHKLQVVDTQGNVLLALTRPAKLVKSKVIVQDGQGREIGAIVQQNAIGKIRFNLEADGHVHGSINAERSPASPRPGRAWPRRCSPRPTTSWCRSTARSRSRCAPWWLPAAWPWTPRSSRTTAASAEASHRWP